MCPVSHRKFLGNCPDTDVVESAMAPELSSAVSKCGIAAQCVHGSCTAWTDLLTSDSFQNMDPGSGMATHH